MINADVEVELYLGDVDLALERRLVLPDLVVVGGRLRVRQERLQACSAAAVLGRVVEGFAQLVGRDVCGVWTGGDVSLQSFEQGIVGWSDSLGLRLDGKGGLLSRVETGVLRLGDRLSGVKIGGWRGDGSHSEG